MSHLRTHRFVHLVKEHLRQAKWPLAGAAVCLLGAVGLQVLAPWPLKIIFDYILLAQSLPPSLAFLDGLLNLGAWPSLLLMAGSIALIAILRSTVSYFQIYTTTKIGYELVYRLRLELFRHLQRLPLQFHHQARTGELLTKFSSDTTTLKDMFADWVLTVTAHVLTLTGMLIVMFLLNWQLSLVITATLPLMAVVLWHLNRRAISSMRTQRKHEGHLSSRVNEILSSMSLVQAFGRQDYEESRFAEESAQNLMASIHTARTTAAMTKAVLILSALGTAGTVFVGAWQVLEHHMSPGDLLIFTAYVKQLYKPVKDLGKLSARYARAVVSARRIAELLDVEPDAPDKPGAIPASRLEGEIRFEGVSFAYQEGRPVLEDVSFHIRAGERVALVGASGAGKSTIVNLVLRLYEPQAGSIWIDGRPITDYQRESLRRQIGIVLQDTVLFGASIAENIAYGKPEATAEDIVAAAKQAAIHDWITTLPDGYDTLIGEQGCTMSGGQRQRICLARAFIKHPSILILDEPTSAVDPVSASLIHQTITQSQQGKTTLFIAHHLNAMHRFDQILVLDHGRIVEHGPHRELLNLKGHYYDLYRSQIA